MKYRTIALTGLLVSLASLTLAHGLRYESYYNWNFLGAGARARAMGGAFLAVSDDGSAATWNPAGLPYNEGVLTSMNWNYVHAAVENNRDGYGEASANLGSIGFWSFLAPLTLYEHEFVGGVTYSRVMDIFYEDGIVARGIVAPQTPVNSADFSSQVRSAGNMSNINLGFGTEVISNLTFGAGVNIVGGDREDSYFHQLTSPEYEYQGKTFIDSAMFNSRADVDYTGVYGNLGVMYRTGAWSAAAVLTTGWTLTEKLDFSTLLTRVERQIREDVLEAFFITERKIDMPYSIGLGGAYRPSERLLIALDYQFRKFKKSNYSTQQILEPLFVGGEEEIEKGILSPASPFTDFPTGWYNLHQVRLGAEYILESGYGRIPLRIGFHNVPTVAGNTSGTRNHVIDYYGKGIWDVMTFPGSSDGDQNMGFGFAFGGGIHWSQIHLDFAFEFETSSSTDSGGYMFNWYDWSEEKQRMAHQEVKLADYSREYKLKQSRFMLNFTGYF